MATPNGTQFQVSTDNSFTTKLIDYSGSYETSHAVTSGTLTRGVTLYSRVRHSSVETGYGSWSPTRQFSISKYLKMVTTHQYTSNSIYCSSAVDSSGNIYSLGTISNGSVFNLLLTKIDNNGNFVWSKQITSDYGFRYSYYNRIKFGSDDSIYINTNVYSSSALTTHVAIIFKLSPDGSTITWKKRFDLYSGSCSSTNIYDIVLDSSDNIYACGEICTDSTTQQGLLIKLNSSGVVQWQRTLKYLSNYGVVLNALTLAPNGYIYTVGDCNSSSSQYYATIFCADADGNYISQASVSFTATYPSSSLTHIRILADSSSNIYAIGYFAQNGTSATHTTVCKYNANLSPLNLNIFTSGLLVYQEALIVNSDLYLVGYRLNTSSIEEGSIIKLNTSDLSIVFQKALSAGATFLGIANLKTGGLILSGYTATKGLLAGFGAGAESATGTIPNMSYFSWIDLNYTLSASSMVHYSTSPINFLSSVVVPTSTPNLTISSITPTIVFSYY